MKKKIVMLMTGMICAVTFLTACEASKGLETDTLKITQYKGVEVAQVQKPGEITDEEVDHKIWAALDAQAETKDIKDRAVKDGDTVNIDFVGKIDGKEFDGGSAKEHDLEIGSDSFIDGFEDSIIGHKIGDEFDWDGKFPDNYGNTEYAGKDVVFTIKVNRITERTVPELTDEVVPKLSEKAKTVEEYKEEVKKQLEDAAEQDYENNLYSEVWNEVLENTEIKKYPDGEKEKTQKALKERYEELAKSFGMEFDEFLQGQMGINEEEFDKQAAQAAEQSVKSKLVTEAIAKKENISLSDEAYEKELEKIVEQYGYDSVEALKEQVEEEELKASALNNLVVEELAKKCIQKADGK